MSNYITGVQVGSEVKQYDYEALGNKPTLVSVDNTLTQSGKAADAKVVGDWFARRNFKLIGDVTVTEVTDGATFSTDLDGNPVGDYDDFFLFAFIVPVNSAECTLSIRTHNGVNYQAMLVDTLTSGKTYCWWHLSEIIGNIDNNVIRKALSPNKLLAPVISDGTIQGLVDTNSSVNSSISLTPATNNNYNVFFYRDGNQFNIGTRFVLFGRKK